MRIGMVCDVYKPHVSGVTHSISLTKRTLEERGHEVFVFTFGDLEYKDDEPKIMRSPGVPLADTGYYFGFRYAQHARRTLQAMDVVHAHHPFLSGRLALRYCRPYQIPIVFTNHTRYDLYAQAYLPILPDQVSLALLQAYLPSFCQDVDLVIAPSEGVRKVLGELGVEGEIQVIPNGVDLAPFHDRVKPIPREELGVRADDTLLIYSGRLGPEKNLTLLVRAFAAAQAAYPKTALLLVGDGTERDNLQHAARTNGVGDRVIFAGMVEYAELPRWLATADAFVTASVTEVHPLSVIEALAAGLPVVGIDSPGVGDIVDDGVNGLLSKNDLAAFTAKLTRFLSETETRERMAREAITSSKQYDIHHTGSILEAHYKRLVETPGRRMRPHWRFLWERMLDRMR